MAATYINTSDLKAGILAASTAGRALIASGFFDEATFTDKVANAAIVPAKLKIASQTYDFSSGTLQAASPTNSADVATKAYVLSVAAGITDWKESARVVAPAILDDNASISGSPTYDNDGGTSLRGQITATLAVTGVFTVDSVSMASTNRLLLAREGDTNGLGADANGIWIVTISGTSLTLDRATDADSDSEVTSGMSLWVNEGTLFGDTQWVLTTDDPITLGGASGTDLVIVQCGSAAVVVAGAGLTESPEGTFNVNVDDSTLEIDTDVVRIKNLGVTFAKLATAVSGRLGGYDRREDFVGDGSTVDFDMAVADVRGTSGGHLVTKNGVVRLLGGGNDYTFSQTGGSGGVSRFTFLTAPEVGANISVIYQRTGNAA